MSEGGIEFRCDHCGRLVRAPRSAAGRRGKCPYCQQAVYIRTPADDLEELDLVPLDEAAEAEEARARRKATRYAADLDRDRAPAEADEDRPPRASSAPIGDADELVADFVRALASSQLEQADSIADRLRGHRAQALESIERVGSAPSPPAGLEEIPGPVVQGFLNTLRERL